MFFCCVHPFLVGSLNYRILQYVRDVCAVVVRTAAGIFNCGGGGGSKRKGGATVVVGEGVNRKGGQLWWE